MMKINCTCVWPRAWSADTPLVVSLSGCNVWNSSAFHSRISKKQKFCNRRKKGKESSSNKLILFVLLKTFVKTSILKLLAS